MYAKCCAFPNIGRISFCAWNMFTKGHRFGKLCIIVAAFNIVKRGTFGYILRKYILCSFEQVVFCTDNM